jgi:hypothetical protein
MCYPRGHVTVTDSHFLRATLGRRILGGFYLGCEMVPAVKDMFTAILQAKQEPSPSDGSGEEEEEEEERMQLLSVVKVSTNIVMHGMQYDMYKKRRREEKTS